MWAKVLQKLKEWFPPEDEALPLPPKPATPPPVPAHKTPRVYPTLPITVPAWQVGYLIQTLVENDLWKKLPYDVAVSINTAYASKMPLKVTKNNLDSLPDSVWLAIENHFRGH